MNTIAATLAAFFCLASPEGVKNPEDLIGVKPAELPEEWYLDFTRTGDRQRHGRPYGQRTEMLEKLIWAEDHDGRKGRYVDTIAEYLKAFNAMKSWNIPAHDASLESWNGTPHIDLGSSRIALAAVQALGICGDRLPAELVRETRENIERRQFAPYFRTLAGEKIKDHWWYHTANNWNAVCNGNVVRSALLYYPVGSEERKRIVDAVLKAFPYFIAGFTDDGYCSEGAGYWSYGFGHYLLAGLALREAPEKIDIFGDPKIKRIARYGFEYKLTAGQSPQFADGGGTPAGCFLGMLGEIWPDLKLDLGLRSEFPDAQVWICRGENFAVGFKGGHNNEFHNHNDLGSYNVLVDGKIRSGDVGGEVYTRRTFSKDRYVSKVLNSYAHPVPRFGGVLQGTGAEYKAKVVRTDFTPERDTVVLDLSGAYPAGANLDSFIRTFTFVRGKSAAFEIEDDIRFKTPTAVEEPVVWTAADPLIPELVADVPCEIFEETVENPGRKPVRIRGLRTTAPVSAAKFKFSFSEKNPLGIGTYTQTFDVKFADAAAAARAECVMTRLPGGADRMLSARWDDSNPAHIAKVKMLNEVGVKATIYANGSAKYLVNEGRELLRLGHAVGNHTTKHPFMMEVSANRDFAEILLNRVNIETNLDASCVSFAQPFGWCAAIDEAKPVLVSDILFNTGHYVSGDNVIPETKGGEKKRYPTRLVRSGDSKIEPEKVAKSFADALEWIAANPRFPRMSYGIHSWCDDAGNKLQAQTIRDAWREDWCTGTDAEYGAYSYQFDNGEVRKIRTEGDTVTFAVRRFDPRPLGSAIPLSLKFSEEPKEIALAKGERGTYVLPHDADRRAVTKIGVAGSEKFPDLDAKLEIFPEGFAELTLVNRGKTELGDLCFVMMAPPKWNRGRSVEFLRTLAPGADAKIKFDFGGRAARKDYAYGPADYACSIDFYADGEACRVWTIAQDAGEEPPKMKTPCEVVKCIGPFDVAKFDAEFARKASIPGAELEDLGAAVNEKWYASGKNGGSGFTVHFWNDFNYHPKDRMDYRDAVYPLVKEKRQARLFVYDFVSEREGTAKLYASTDRGLPAVSPRAWVNGAETALERKVVNAIPVRKGVNRVVVELGMVQTRWPESVLMIVCEDGLDSPLPAADAALQSPK